MSESDCDWCAVGRYTFGKPLTDAEVLVTVKYPYYYNRNRNMAQPTLTKTGTVNATAVGYAQSWSL